MKTQAFARVFRTAAAAALLVFAVSSPVAHAQVPGATTPRAAVDRNFLIGSWSDAGDCSTTVAFLADGGYATADGAEGQ